MIYPDFPHSGDYIGICAPSAGVGHKQESFDSSIDTLHNLGFRTIESASVRNDDCPSASPEVRGKEFNDIFSNLDVRSVFCATGGDFLMEMLPYINIEEIRKKPKWFIGYSDPTSIHILLTSICDIASIYGVNAGSFDAKPLLDFQKNALSIISGDIVQQHSFETYDSMPFDDDAGDERYKLVNWQLYVQDGNEWHRESKLKVSGRLIGGCSDCIDTILGTPYEDLKGFSERYADDGLIWFFDPFAQHPFQLRMMMAKMKFMGLFDNAKLIVFGRVMFPGDNDDTEYIHHLQQIIPGIPFIWGADIGHTKPSMTLINGSIGTIEYENNTATLTMALK